MDRRAFLRGSGAASLLGLAGRRAEAARAGRRVRRVRPGDADWPSQRDWKRLNDEVGGNLIGVEFPLKACAAGAESDACRAIFADLKNPFAIGDSPALTQTLGWVDAWTTKPSVYAVAARDARDIAAAVNFAREHGLRLVVKGGGHSYQGTSNAPDSLLIWTRHMHDVAIEPAFVPRGCAGTIAPQRAVSVGAGAIWLQAYDAVTTKAGAYVQGGGCTTVGVAGLIQSGGFGSFSKHFGLAAGGLIEAEVVTADGRIRIANARTNPDLFWALKGGGGGTFGVVSRLTLRVRELPEFAGGANFGVRAASDEAYRRLIRYFVSFYREALFNDRWGEQAHFSGDNRLVIGMVHLGLETGESEKIWRPFLDWVKRRPEYRVESAPVIGSMPFRGWWDPEWRREHHHAVFRRDRRAEAGTGNVWWNGDAGQVGWVVWGFGSVWMPASLLEESAADKLAEALFGASRWGAVELHFNKGLAGAPAEAIEAAKDTAMNPAVCGAFALAIVAAGQGPAYPGISGREPDLERGRKAAERVRSAMKQLREAAGAGGAYVSESDYFESGFGQAYWGSNYARLEKIKKQYDGKGLFYVHNGVGSERWAEDGFRRL